METKAISESARSTRVKGIRQFCGAASYYRRFSADLSSIATPLTLLTKKIQPFRWEADQEEACITLKKCLVTAPVLSHFDPDLLVAIETDVSLESVDAVLKQGDRDREYVVAYTSRVLLEAEKRYRITELLLLAAVYGIGKFYCHVAGNRPFKIITEHSAIGPLIHTKNPTGRLARWVLRLWPYRFEIVSRAGKENVLVDWLSRFSVDTCEEPVLYFSSASSLFLPRLDNAALQLDEAFCRSFMEVLEGSTDTETYRYKILYYIMKSGILYRKSSRDGREHLLLVLARALQTKVLCKPHDSVLFGHLGIA